MKGIYAAWFGLFAVCAYGAWQLAMSNFHIPLQPPEFSTLWSIDPQQHQHNQFGDHTFYCQTAFCNPTDMFIGEQTGILYKNKQSAIDGIALAKATARIRK